MPSQPCQKQVVGSCFYCLTITRRERTAQISPLLQPVPSDQPHLAPALHFLVLAAVQAKSSSAPQAQKRRFHPLFHPPPQTLFSPKHPPLASSPSACTRSFGLAMGDAPGGFGESNDVYAAMSLSGEGDTLKGTYKHCQEEQLGKIGAGGPCKKHFQNEDKILIQMINSGQTNWGTVACAIPGRNAQQCRLRWTCTLDPAINKQAWSQEEELRLIRAQQTYGNKWSAMYVSNLFKRLSVTLIVIYKQDKQCDQRTLEGSYEKKVKFDFSKKFLNSDSDILQQCDGSSDENQLLSDIQGRLKSKQGTSSKSKQGASSKCDGSSDENQLLSDLRSSLKSKQGASSKRDNSSDEDELLSGLRARLKSKQGTNKKSKQEFIKPRENTDQSEGECAEFMCTKGPDTDSVDVSQRIKDRVNERKRARKRLVLLSSPVELKVSAMAKSERPQQEGKQMSPEVNIISPPAILQEFSPEVPSECEKMVEPLVADCKQAKNVCSSLKTSDPCTLEQHLADISDLLDMSYCDGLMIIPPAGCANDDCFV
uniref:Uncharacterized protein n=1 Tax=Leersia perrieri TaxID=77586 RepID=A0A0D9VEL7_9ORYZ